MIEKFKRSVLVQRLPPPVKRVLKRVYNISQPPNSTEDGQEIGAQETGGQEIVGQDTGGQDPTVLPTTVHQFEAAIVRIYQLALLRTPAPEERQVWLGELQSQRMNMAMVLETIAGSEEAAQVRSRGQIVPQVSNGRLVQFTYEFLLGRGAMAAEILHWDHRMRHQNLGRDQFVLSLFGQRAAEALTEDAGISPTNDPGVAHVMGTDRFIRVKDWQGIAAGVPESPPPFTPRLYSSLRMNLAPAEIVVSAIASLYRGGDYIEQFLENITSQTIFAHSELIIIDAHSPENEFEVISRYMKRFPNIVYHRAATRIGIYEAWNLGVHLSKGRYLTNTNLDDLRRIDSFERQAELLEKFSFVDVVYQDFFFSFEGDASFNRSAAVGVHSELPVVTPYNLMQSNSPHNAPMWRRTLHTEVGLFDPSFRSAGDYEFWLRCCHASRTFFKTNDPHVIYFVNPQGLSTQPDTRGIDEANRITKSYGQQLVSEWIITEEEVFLSELERRSGQPVVISESERIAWDWRYLATQRALRQLSISARVRSQ